MKIKEKLKGVKSWALKAMQHAHRLVTKHGKFFDIIVITEISFIVVRYELFYLIQL